VNAVVVFDEHTPLDIITAIQPDILVKGADWGPENIVGREIVERRGGRVVRLELAKGFSTTSLIGKMRPPASS
jgi:bifunctional ADP-heptose synthase (sugar kinase/adenylyltransferase)